MPRPTEEQVKQFIENVIGMEETFPTPGHDWGIKKFFETFFPEREAVDGVKLRPGDQFCIDRDGSAFINRADGSSQKFYPEDGCVSISIDV